MKEPRVKELIEHYQKGNLEQVYIYLTQSNMKVDPDTWSGQIKKLIESKKFFSAKMLIESIAYKFLKLK